MNTKSQVKLFETVSILVVFFFLLAFGLVFYARMQQGSHEATLSEGFQLKTIDIVQVISHIPELQCSSENIVTDNCYDILKLDAFSDLLVDTKNRLYYHNHFSYCNITVTQVYPLEDRTWPIYYHVPPEWNEKSKSHIPILLYDPPSRKYKTGVLTIEVFR